MNQEQLFIIEELLERKMHECGDDTLQWASHWSPEEMLLPCWADVPESPTRAQRLAILLKIREQYDSAITWVKSARDAMDKALLSRAYYQELLGRSEFLGRLEDAGVDNWEGYSMCQDEDETEEQS